MEVIRLVSEAERNRILEIAEKLGVDESDVVDTAIKEFLAKHK